MVRDLIYGLLILMIFVGAYVGYLGLQRQAYIIYTPLFVEAYSRSFETAKSLESYPSTKNLHDEIFKKKQKELSLKIVTNLLEINNNLNFGGELKKTLLKYKTSQNPDRDFYLLREFQENIKLLPPITLSVPQRFYYFAASSLTLSYNELLSLDGLKWTFIQKVTPLEMLLNSQQK